MAKKLLMPPGEYLRECREEQGMSQREVALMLGYQTPQFVWAVENCQAGIPPKLMKNWSNCVGADKKHLLKLLELEYHSEVTTNLGL